MAGRKQLRVEIVGDATKARKALAQLDSSLAGTESTSRKLGRKLTTVLAGAGAIALGTSAIRMATDLEKSQLAMEGLYGDAQLAEDTIGELNKIASRSSLSFSGYVDAAGTLAYAGIQGERTTKILENVGKAIVGMGGDTSNLDRASEALLKMVSSGRIYKRDLDSLSQSGVPIIEGLATAAGVSVDRINEMVREGKIGLEDVLDVMEHGTGEYFEAQIAAADRVEEGTAASVGRMKENFLLAVGQGIMPALEAITPVADLAGQAVAAIPSEALTVAMGAGGAWVAWSKWGDAIKKVGNAETWDNLRLGLMGVTEAGGGAMNKFGGLMRVVKNSPMIWATGAAAAGGLVMILADLQGQSKRTQRNVEDLLNAYKAGESWQDAFNEKLLNTFLNIEGGFDLGDWGNAFREAMDRTGTSVKDLSAGLQLGDEAYTAFRDALEKEVLAALNTGVGAKVMENVDSMRDAFTGAQSTAETLKDESEKLGLELDGVSGSADGAADASDDMADAMDEQAKKTEEAKEEIEKLSGALKDYGDAATLLLSGNIEVQSELDKLADALKENGNRWDIADEKGRANYSTLISLKDAMYKVAQSMIDQGEPIDTVTWKWLEMVGQLKDTMIQAGLTEEEVESLIEEMGLTPDTVQTVFESNASDAMLEAQALRDVFESLPRRVRVDVETAMYGNVHGDFWGAPPPGGNWIGHRLGPGWSVVGEQGPELIHRDEVIGAGRTQAALDRLSRAPTQTGPAGSVQVAVNVAGSVITERDLAVVVREQVLELQKRSAPGLLPGVAG